MQTHNKIYLRTILRTTLLCISALIQSAAHTSDEPQGWPIVTEPAWQSQFGTAVLTAPLVALSKNNFAVVEHNKLCKRSFITGMLKCFKKDSPIIAEHPNFLTNSAPYALPVKLSGPSVHPGYIVTTEPEKKPCIEDIPTLTALRAENPLIEEVSVTHRSIIRSCVRYKDIIASASEWHILLTNQQTEKTHILQHRLPVLFSGTSSLPEAAKFGPFGSDNWISGMDMTEKIVTGQFDGSIFVWSIERSIRECTFEPIKTDTGYPVSKTIKQIGFADNETSAFALTRHGLRRVDVRDNNTEEIPKPSESGRFESMLLDSERNMVYCGSDDGAVYLYDLRTRGYEQLTHLNGFIADKEKRSVQAIAKAGSALYIGTIGGEIYVHSEDDFCIDPIYLEGSSPICALLATEKHLVFSTRDGLIHSR